MHRSKWRRGHRNELPLIPSRRTRTRQWRGHNERMNERHRRSMRISDSRDRPVPLLVHMPIQRVRARERLAAHRARQGTLRALTHQLAQSREARRRDSGVQECCIVGVTEDGMVRGIEMAYEVVHASVRLGASWQTAVPAFDGRGRRRGRGGGGGGSRKVVGVGIRLGLRFGLGIAVTRTWRITGRRRRHAIVEVVGREGHGGSEAETQIAETSREQMMLLRLRENLPSRRRELHDRRWLSRRTLPHGEQQGQRRSRRCLVSEAARAAAVVSSSRSIRTP